MAIISIASIHPEGFYNLKLHSEKVKKLEKRIEKGHSVFTIAPSFLSYQFFLLNYSNSCFLSFHGTVSCVSQLHKVYVTICDLFHVEHSLSFFTDSVYFLHLLFNLHTSRDLFRFF